MCSYGFTAGLGVGRASQSVLAHPLGDTQRSRALARPPVDPELVGLVTPTPRTGNGRSPPSPTPTHLPGEPEGQCGLWCRTLRVWPDVAADEPLPAGDASPSTSSCPGRGPLWVSAQPPRGTGQALPHNPVLEGRLIPASPSAGLAWAELAGPQGPGAGLGLEVGLRWMAPGITVDLGAEPRKRLRNS